MVMVSFLMTIGTSVTIDRPGRRLVASGIQTSRFWDHAKLDEMREQAKSSPRGRFGQLLHNEFYARLKLRESYVAAAAAQDVQRFLNVFAHDSYVMPHVHPEKGKWEVFTHVAGDFKVVAFEPSMASNSTENVAESVTLNDEVPLIFVYAGTWHSIAAIDEAGAVEFEFKPGPYGGVAKDKQFSFQLDNPWAFNETQETSMPLLQSYVDDLREVKGFKASDPVTDLHKYRYLKPYLKSDLLTMLHSGPERKRVVGTGPGKIKPIATILAAPPPKNGSSVARAVHLEVPQGPWKVFVWLAGGAARLGKKGSMLEVGPNRPLLEIWGQDHKNAFSHGLTAIDKLGSVVLELSPELNPLA